MSQKGKKSKAVGSRDNKEGTEKVSRPTGRTPMATVSSRSGSSMIIRTGKGFSFGETKNAGLSLNLAKRWGLPLDIRRRSVLDGNVESVKAWATHAKPSKKEKVKESELKKVEEEVVKIEKKVKKEAAKIKAEAKKLEKEVAEEIEKPAKPRARKKKAAKAE